MNPRGTNLLEQLPADTRKQLLDAGRGMTRLAINYPVPIILAPPPGMAGKINGATGFALQLPSGISSAIRSTHAKLRGRTGNWMLCSFASRKMKQQTLDRS